MNPHTPPRDPSGPAGHLVVLGSGPQAEWEYALHSLAATGPLLLIDERPPTLWQRPHLAGARTAILSSPKHIQEEIRKFAVKRRIQGVITLQQAHTLTAAHLRQQLNLPGHPLTAAETTALRPHTTQLLTAARLDHAGSIHARTYDEAIAAAHHLEFPLVCKPASPRKRHTARHVSTPPELAEAFSAATATTTTGTGTILEPHIDGIEATAHTLTTPTGTRVIAVSHTTLDPRAEPALLPLQTVVDADDVCATTVEGTAQRTLSALGIHSGPAQIRMQITATGPRVLSVTTHPTDPLTCSLIEHVTGINLITEAAHHARGETTTPNPARIGAAAARYIQGPRTTPLPPRTATPTRITPYATLHHYPAPHRVGPLTRQGHILVHGTDYPQCAARLKGAADALRPRPEPAHTADATQSRRP